jgi:Rieske Fe-S protein
MNERRRFLKVIGGSVIAIGAAPLAEGCGSEGGDPTGGAGGTGGTGGVPVSTTSSAGGATSSSQSAGGATGSTGTGCALPPGVAAGTPDLYATDGLHKVPGTKVLVGRDAAGLYALSSKCTHNNCDMNGKFANGTPVGTISATKIHCNCHGSEFDNLGIALKGPNPTPTNPNPSIPKPLPCYRMELGCDGQLYVDATTPADRNVDRVTE